MTVYAYVANTTKTANDIASHLLINGQPHQAFMLCDLSMKSIKAYQSRNLIEAVADASIIDYYIHLYGGGNQCMA